MAGSGDDPAADDPMVALMAPELVAPMVAFLAHEDVPGQRRDLHRRRGALRPHLRRVDRGLRARRRSPDGGGRRRPLGAINDESGYFVPVDLMDWSAQFTAHQR